MRSGTHAIDRPLGVAMLVAYCNAEATVVGSDEVDHMARVTLHIEGGSFTRVRRSVARTLESLGGGQ